MHQNQKPVYLSLPTSHCFNHALLAERLQLYRSIPDKISLMLKQGEIVRIRRGLYARSRMYGGTVEPIEVANLIYGPSCISLEYALSYYGMIPERVETITSVTPKRSKKVFTPFGSFSYEHLPMKAYSVGINLENRDGAGFLIASREKSLCDRIALTSNIRTTGEIEAYIFENLRIDEENFSGMSTDLLKIIAQVYGMKRVTLFMRWYVTNIGK
jgi:hypothetical protein